MDRAGWFFGGRRPLGLEGGWGEEGGGEEEGKSWREGVVIFGGGCFDMSIGIDGINQGWAKSSRTSTRLIAMIKD